MPAPGSVWATNIWDADAWAADTWADSQEQQQTSAPVGGYVAWQAVVLSGSGFGALQALWEWLRRPDEQ